MPTENKKLHPLIAKLAEDLDVLDDRCVRLAVTAIERLLKDFGLINSIQKKECVDKDNNPIPWYTFPAIEYIKQLDFSEKRVFEYGCGNSSKFWASIAKEVVSVEEKKDWYEQCLKDKAENQILIFGDNEENYINSILDFEDFDVIVVDGDPDRYKCTENALKKLKDGGIIIIDNSDRAADYEIYSGATKLLRENDFIQADMSGFGPINNYTWTTSFFFSKNFNNNIKPKNPEIQPLKSIGNI